MEKIDALKHSPQMQYEIRKQVIRLRQAGIQKRFLQKDLVSTLKIWRSYKNKSSKAISLMTTGVPSRRTTDAF